MVALAEFKACLLYTSIKKHPMTGRCLPRYGSANLVNKANATNALPTRNFQSGHFEDVYKRQV